jgi:predicted  nucleic acid-binding Zn-ribbon protein
VRPAAPVASVSGAERRAAEKELASVERRMAKVADGIRVQHDAFAAADQSDYALLQRLQAELAGLEAESTQLENRWLELSELLEG